MTKTLVMTFPTTLGVLGGGTVGCIEIVRALQQAGVQVILCLADTRILNRGVFRCPPLEEEYQGREAEQMLRDLGVEIVRVPPVRSHFLYDCLPMRDVVLRLCDQRPVDAVLGWHHELTKLPIPLAKRGIPTGMFVAGWYNRFRRHEIRANGGNLKERWKLRAEKHFLRQGLEGVDCVFAISQWSRSEIVDVFDLDANRVHVVYWGVDPVFATPTREPRDQVRNFLFYGSQNPRKGALEAMEALASLAEKGQRDWVYKVVWLHTDRVAARAAELGISEQVVPIAPMDHAGLVRELQWAQVAVLPSLFESFGLACAEALTSGIPVIAYDCAGVPEVVRHGVDGWLVENGRKEQLEHPIAEAIAQPRRTFEMGLAGRERAQRDFTWSQAATSLLEHLDAARDRRQRA